MRPVRTLLAGAFCVAAVLASTAPASADTTYKWQNDATNDFVLYNATTNSLRVCDNSAGNGTAVGILEVIGGNTKTVFDTNGNQDPCANTGTLGVDDSKSAYLWICANGSAPCVRSPWSFGL